MDKDLKNLQKIWDYITYSNPLEKADLIIAFGCMDLSIADRAVKIYKQVFADKILFSGGFGKDTGRLWNKTEAEVFAEIAIKAGVPKSAIILEDKSTNTGENIKFTRQLVEQNNLKVSKVIVIHQPCMGRRIFAALKKQWPELDFIVAPVDCNLSEYVDRMAKLNVRKESVYSIMVGDLQRIKIFAKKGYQIEQKIPDEVWQAYEELVKAGYTQYLI